MSRGPGKIERAVEKVFLENPDSSFTVEDLADRVFFGANRIEKKHRVSLIRATRKVCARLDWDYFLAGSRGGTIVYFNPYDVISYGSAQIKSGDCFNHYRSKDNRIPDHWRTTGDDVRKMLQPGGRKHDYVAEGGTWWKFVKMNVIVRDKDSSPEAKKIFEGHNRFRVRYGAKPWNLPEHFNEVTI